jgi:putative hemolysin
MRNSSAPSDEQAPFNKRLREIGTALLSRGLGLHRIEKMVAALGPDLDAQGFLDAGLGRLGVRADVPELELDRIPSEGACIAVANHPYGLLDGMMLSQVLLSRRKDVKILANPFLARFEPLREIFFWVDPFGNESSKSFNRRALAEAIRWVQDGHLLLVFPAGEVSHRRWGRKGITDPDWHATVARIQMRCQAPVLPIHVSGCNSVGFQVVGLLHPRLRTLLLARELLNKMDRRIPIRIGHAIQEEALTHFPTAEARTAFFRLSSDVQGRRVECSNERKRFRLPVKRSTSSAPQAEAICPPVSSLELQREIEGLGAERILSEGGQYQVYFAEAAEIPAGLREIGRLREETFRAVGEGTGKSLDLDAFDEHYQHLLLWDRQGKEIAGSYRVGPTDLLAERGCDWYTKTLFRFDPRFVEHVTPGLELGRSFIGIAHQRSFRPLLLLWQAIGAYCVRMPRYRRLFGPVSISKDYAGLSRDLILDHLSAHHGDAWLSQLVKPRRPVSERSLRRRRTWPQELFPELGEVSKFVSEIEEDKKGVPVLIREYLKLGGRLLGFNVDPDFSDVLDGLVLVDLDATDPKRLARYMGADGAARFRSLGDHHAGC